MTRMSSETRAMIGALIPIYGITLVDCFGYMIMVPLLPYLAQKFGASGMVVGALLATMAIASTVAAPFWGALSDRVGRKPIVLISQIISLIGYSRSRGHRRSRYCSCRAASPGSAAATSASRSRTSPT
jgi:MFS family permease